MTDVKPGNAAKPAPERIAALKNLPKETMKSLTREETKAFLFDDEWPDSLREKLKDFIVE